MKYYYLTADGATAGPETLATLTTLMAQGGITPATMVVPAGGEDWTPLARVLRYFYPDDTGATMGPVAFSELNRLNQIAALGGDAWVLEEGGTEWKALSSILEAGGVSVAAPVPQVARIPAGVYRPPAASAAGGRQPVVRRALGGLRRGPFFFGLLLVLILLTAALFVTARVTKMALDKVNSYDGLFALVERYLLALKLILLTTWGGIILCLGLRLKNIGWSLLWLLAFLLPLALPLLFGLIEVKAWMAGAWGISVLAGLIFFIPVASLPPSYKRHHRLDTAAKILPVVILLVYGGLFAWGYTENKKLEKKQAEDRQKAKEKPPEVTEPDPSKPGTAHSGHTGVDTGWALR